MDEDKTVTELELVKERAVNIIKHCNAIIHGYGGLSEMYNVEEESIRIRDSMKNIIKETNSNLLRSKTWRRQN